MAPGLLQVALLALAAGLTPEPLYKNRNSVSVPELNTVLFSEDADEPASYYIGQNASYKQVGDVPYSGIISIEHSGMHELIDGVLQPAPIDFAAELENRTCGHEEDIVYPNTTIPGTYEYLPPNPPGLSTSEAVDQYFPKCYPGDVAGKYIDIAIVTDVALYQQLGSSVSAVKNFVEDTIVRARLVYYRQFNLILRIHSLRIFTGTGKDPGYPLNSVKSDTTSTCVYDHSFVLDQVSKWTVKNPPPDPDYAAVHYFTGCWGPTGVVGIAYLDRICTYSAHGITTRLSSSSTWLIFAHELAHNLAASHTFQFGIGRTGGLMDYGNPYYNNEIQFRPESAASICGALTRSVTNPVCNAFSPVSSFCGDGVLEKAKGEECECLDNTSSCKGCESCKLTNAKTECSIGTFVMGSKDDGDKAYVAVSTSMLHDPRCCTEKGEMKTSKNLCGDGVCSNGRCVRICSLYLYLACDMMEDGCTQPCRPSNNYNYCITSIFTSRRVPISHLPNGTKCGDVAGRRSVGTCLSGKCVNMKQPNLEPEDTLFPTVMPTKSPTVFRNVTRSPTAARGTKAPSRKTTRRPTMGGTRFPTPYRVRRSRSPSMPNNSTGKLPYRVCHSDELNEHCFSSYKTRLACNQDERCAFRPADMSCRASCDFKPSIRR